MRYHSQSRILLHEHHLLQSSSLITIVLIILSRIYIPYTADYDRREFSNAASDTGDFE